MKECLVLSKPLSPGRHCFVSSTLTRALRSSRTEFSSYQHAADDENNCFFASCFCSFHSRPSLNVLSFKATRWNTWSARRLGTKRKTHSALPETLARRALLFRRALPRVSPLLPDIRAHRPSGAKTRRKQNKTKQKLSEPPPGVISRTQLSNDSTLRVSGGTFSPLRERIQQAIDEFKTYKLQR